MRVVIVSGPITWSKVLATPGTLLQVDRVTVTCGRPDTHILAAYCADEPKPQAAALLYDATRRGWALETESFGEKRNGLIGDRLDKLIVQFEQMAGAAVQPITFVDNVSGEYVVGSRRSVGQEAA